MDPKQLVLQLGIAGAVLYVGYRIAILLINNWRATESERLKVYTEAEEARTLAITVGFTTLNGKVDAHHTADITSHGEMAKGLSRLEGKVDAALELTPRPQEIPTRPNTPPQGVPAGYYPPSRPKTSGGR